MDFFEVLPLSLAGRGRLLSGNRNFTALNQQRNSLTDELLEFVELFPAVTSPHGIAYSIMRPTHKEMRELKLLIIMETLRSQ